MSTDTYMVVASPLASASHRALARSYRHLVDAVSAMGDGVVVTGSGRVVAFHERHLPMFDRAPHLLGA